MKLTLRPAEESDFAFAFKAKHEALGPHVRVRWGWNESFQLGVHTKRWGERPWFIVEGPGESIGTVSVQLESGRVRFGEFYLLPRWQGQGFGSRVLSFVVREADVEAMPVELEYLKWNPVGSLYKRHGFEVVGESEIHYCMHRPPGANPSIERTSLSWLRQPKAAAHVERWAPVRAR
jgi:GNAT superfamily N-acetyltransferase